jgi:hypothetical protein
MDIRLPNGTVIRGVPEGTSKEAIQQKAIDSGLATAQDFGVVQEQPVEQPIDTAGISEQVLTRLSALPDSAAPMAQRIENFRANVQAGMPEHVALEQAMAQSLDSGEELSKAGRFVSGIPGALPSLVSGAVAAPAGGVAGAVTSAIPGLAPGSGAGVAKGVQERLTIDPIGERAKETLSGVGEALKPVMQGVRSAGEAVGDVTGSPLAATAFETAALGIPEALGFKGARSILKTPSKRMVDVPEPGQVRTAREASEATGVDLFEAQQTLSAPALERQSFVQQLPAGVRKASRELEQQNIQASEAVDRLLTRIGPDDSIVKGQEKFRSAAQRAVEQRKNIRKERSSPLYNEAFSDARKGGLKVNVDDIKDKFSTIAEDFPETGKIRQTITKAVNLMDSQDLKRLHNSKLEIDELIAGRGENALGNTSKANLVELKQGLVKRLADASPAYEKARSTFEANSPAVTAIEESVIGKVAALDDMQLKTISTKIFDPQQSNVKVVSDARKVISEVDPQSWDMLMRSEIERRMGSIKSSELGSIENVPGKLRNAIFGNAKQKNTLLAGADASTRKSLESLDTALKRASLGRERGSQTASRGEIRKELRGGVVSGLRDLFRQPVDTIIRTGEDAQFDARVSAMADALFDPKYKAETSKLISTGRGKDLTRLILSIEALRSSGREGIAQQQQEQAEQGANR